jgi:hypothetical protein
MIRGRFPTSCESSVHPRVGESRSKVENGEPKFVDIRDIVTISSHFCESMADDNGPTAACCACKKVTGLGVCM